MEAESIAWLILLCLFLLIEIATLGLTTIWFAGGALVAFIAAVCGLNVVVQIIIFFVLSIILLVFTRPLAVNYFNKSRVATNTESLIGAEAKVVETINNIDNAGVVNLNGLDWTARSVDNQIIPVGTIVRIVKITGVKAIVEIDTKKEQEHKDENQI
ncbi:MAG: NfeD family protein [bacterium]|nr:NfeD family protein [bacterium]